jgi:cytochrome b561
VSDINAPADPKNTPAYRVAKAAVIVLSALIILALIVLVVGIGMKMAGRSVHLFGGSDTPAPPQAAADGTAFALPPGAKVTSSESQPGRLILHVHAAAGDEIDIVSTDDGHLISRIGPTK